MPLASAETRPVGAGTVLAAALVLAGARPAWVAKVAALTAAGALPAGASGMGGAGCSADYISRSTGMGGADGVSGNGKGHGGGGGGRWNDSGGRAGGDETTDPSTSLTAITGSIGDRSRSLHDCMPQFVATELMRIGAKCLAAKKGRRAAS